MTLRKLFLPRKAAEPKFEPLHPAFTGRAKVLSQAAQSRHKLNGFGYLVDLDANVCNCPYGAAFVFDTKLGKYVPNAYCTHKIKFMSHIVEQQDRSYDIEIPYCEALAIFYNINEIRSSFRKELRRGHIENSILWGSLLNAVEGSTAVIKYMLDAVFAETRNYLLAKYLLSTYLDMDGMEDSHTYLNFKYWCYRFCKSEKIWKHKGQYEILENELLSYKKLLSKYGHDVVKDQSISVKERKFLLSELKAGIKNTDIVKAKFGLFGLQRLRCNDINNLRVWIANELEIPNEYIERRVKHKLGVGFHDLVMLLEWQVFGNEMLTFVHVAPPDVGNQLKLKIGCIPAVPIYAHDNATWAGKRMITRHPEEYLPEAMQTKIDLRLSDAYIGICWRFLAYKQHGRIDCEWNEVKWPQWMWDIASQLWH